MLGTGARFDHALASVDTDGAVGLVEGLLADGADPVDVLVDVIAAAQREVGGRWQRGEWSVAREHVATAATEAVARHARRVPVRRGRVVIACAEREWHAMPAMIIGCAIRANGWAVTQLGAATPPVRLSQYLHDSPWARPRGRPVRGRPSTHWTGCRRWCPASRRCPHRPSPSRPRSNWPTTGGWTRSLPGGPVPGQPDEVHAVASDAVHQALHAVSAALITGDERPVPETVAWVGQLLSARGGAAGLVPALGDRLRSALLEYPLAHALVTRHWPS